MAAPATPRRGVFGRLVGSLSQLVASPRPQTAPHNRVFEAAYVAPDPPALTQDARFVEDPAPATTIDEPGTPDDWNPSMMQAKHISEMEKMWNEVIQTPQRQSRPRNQSVIRPRTCPPKWRNTPTNHRNDVEMPRSALKKKKREAPEDEEYATPSRGKRVKFNTFLEERILSPSHSGQAEAVPEQQAGISYGRKRPRATDPYSGKEFSDSPNLFEEDPPSKRVRYEDLAANKDLSQVSQDSPERQPGIEGRANNTPVTQNNTNTNGQIGQNGSEAFKPSRCHPTPGTWTLDYDTYGENDDFSDLEADELSELVALERRKDEIRNLQRERANLTKQASQENKIERTNQVERTEQVKQAEPVTTDVTAAPSEHQPSTQQQTTKSSNFSLDFSDESDRDGSSSSLTNSANHTPTKSQPAAAAAATIKTTTTQPTPKDPPPPPPQLQPSDPTNNPITQTQTQTRTQIQIQSPDSNPDPTSPRTPPSPSTNLSIPISDTRATAIDRETKSLTWPRAPTYVESGIASQPVVDLLDRNWDEGDDYYSRLWWEREFGLFRQALQEVEDGKFQTDDGRRGGGKPSWNCGQGLGELEMGLELEF